MEAFTGAEAGAAGRLIDRFFMTAVAAWIFILLITTASGTVKTGATTGLLGLDLVGRAVVILITTFGQSK